MSYHYPQSLSTTQDDTLLANWCELSSTREEREEDGKLIYHNAFATSHNVNVATVQQLVPMGRWRGQYQSYGSKLKVVGDMLFVWGFIAQWGDFILFGSWVNGWSY